MASGPITSWQINGEKMETVTGFIFLGFKISQSHFASANLPNMRVTPLLWQKAKKN